MLAGSQAATWAADQAADLAPSVRVGLVTDLHYAERLPAGTRYYEESLPKLAEAVKQFQQNRTDFVVELGDLIDSNGNSEADLKCLRRVVETFKTAPGMTHYVLGNHCVSTLTRAQFSNTVRQKESYYSFDFAGYHFIVLDACYRKDGTPYEQNNFDWTDANLSPAEVEWLQADLTATPHKTVVFIHQRLDVSDHYGVGHSSENRKLLEQSGKVLAVVQGHYHKNDFREINGIHYCTLAAMVDGAGENNSAYATLDIFLDGAIHIAGFRNQETYDWK